MDVGKAGGERPATLGSAIGAVLTLPATVAVAIPLWMAHSDTGLWPVNVFGLAVSALGLFLLGRTVHAFFVQGRGTLAPWDPPRRLVVSGPFARCRNPMYVGVLTLLVGHAWTFGSWRILVYAAFIAVAFHLRVVLAEERWAAERFPADWPAYRANVPRWIPRFEPWRPDADR